MSVAVDMDDRGGSVSVSGSSISSSSSRESYRLRDKTETIDTALVETMEGI